MSGSEKAFGGLKVPPIIGSQVVARFPSGRRWLLPTHQGQDLVAVAGGATQTDTFYRTELVDAPRLATGYLL